MKINMTRMHYFGVLADRETGAWDESSIAYLGTIFKDDFCALQDTDDVHYDQHDGETFSPRAMAEAGISTKQNVALKVTWVD